MINKYVDITCIVEDLLQFLGLFPFLHLVCDRVLISYDRTLHQALNEIFMLFSIDILPL